MSVGVSGSLAASLLVSSSSSSGIGLWRSTGLDSGDDVWLVPVEWESVWEVWSSKLGLKERSSIDRGVGVVANILKEKDDYRVDWRN